MSVCVCVSVCVHVCVCVCVCGLPGKVLPLMGTDGHAKDDKREQTHAHYTHTHTHNTRLSNKIML